MVFICRNSLGVPNGSDPFMSAGEMHAHTCTCVSACSSVLSTEYRFPSSPCSS